jgi:hypothetical protein
MMQAAISKASERIVLGKEPRIENSCYRCEGQRTMPLQKSN